MLWPMSLVTGACAQLRKHGVDSPGRAYDLVVRAGCLALSPGDAMAVERRHAVVKRGLTGEVCMSESGLVRYASRCATASLSTLPRLLATC